MNNQEDIWGLVFFACAYGLIFSFGYWFVNASNAIESPSTKQQCIEYACKY